MTASIGRPNVNERGKYKKYKEETHKLSILVDQLQKKLKKYHDENKVLIGPNSGVKGEAEPG